MVKSVKSLGFVKIFSTFAGLGAFSTKSGLKFNVVLSIAGVFTLVFIAFPVDPMLIVVAHIDYGRITFPRGHFYWDYYIATSILVKR